MKKLIQIPIEETLHIQLEELAKIDHRSKTSEALSILERAVLERLTELGERGIGTFVRRTISPGAATHITNLDERERRANGKP